MAFDIEIKQLGLVDYQTTFDAMRAFTEQRIASRAETGLRPYTALNNQTHVETQDQIWICEHPPVFTQGKHGKAEHIIHPNHDIPIIQTDRGGQVTYHGPGQLIAYFLIDLKHNNIGIKHLVNQIEQSVLGLLAQYGVTKAHLIDGAPGIYVDQRKIASLGLRVKHGMTYHGLALNVNMDLTPFSYINPCGYQGLEMTQLSEFNLNITLQKTAADFLDHFLSLKCT